MCRYCSRCKKNIAGSNNRAGSRSKKQGYTLAAERDGKVLDFADFGNSPDLFTPERVKDKVIAYSTTNGTQAIEMAADAKQILIGSFINLSAVTDFLINNPTPVLFLCSGWKNKFNLEDTLCVGAIAQKLLESGKYQTVCDSTYAAIDLWDMSKSDLMKYLEKASHRHRLKTMVDEQIIKYCHTIDLVNVLPAYKNGFIEKI
jgi:2-phosphosulfolactate phosphatase